MLDDDTIAAIATPEGSGGIGIVRVSGALANAVAIVVCRRVLQARHATFCKFYSESGDVIDEGIVILYRCPHSFTGENVLELQGHGGSIIIKQLLRRVLALGVRLAEPGEFSYRAFLNEKMDLLQAEAISDLITAKNDFALSAAKRTMRGEFSNLVSDLQQEVNAVRVQVEAIIDFPEEELGVATERFVQRLQQLKSEVATVIIRGESGRVLSDGVCVALVGPPNAGKSSLLNCLSQEDSAIVTDIPGTTRDAISVDINHAGIGLCLVDTAGVRDTDDIIEKEGVRRSLATADSADVVLFVLPADKDVCLNPFVLYPDLMARLPQEKVVVVVNKVDLVSVDTKEATQKKCDMFYVSAKTGEGVGALLQHVVARVSGGSVGETEFVARERHMQALMQVESHMTMAEENLLAGVLDLAAEELRLAQQDLSCLTGEVTPDNLLGQIFSSFCVGK